MQKVYIVRLTDQERTELQSVVKKLSRFLSIGSES